MTLMMAAGTRSARATTNTRDGTWATEVTRSQRPMAITPAMVAQSTVSSALSRSSARRWNPAAINTMMPRPTAASGVSQGQTPVAMGNTRATAPSTSARPMNTT